MTHSLLKSSNSCTFPTIQLNGLLLSTVRQRGKAEERCVQCFTNMHSSKSGLHRALTSTSYRLEWRLNRAFSSFSALLEETSNIPSSKPCGQISRGVEAIVHVCAKAIVPILLANIYCIYKKTWKWMFAATICYELAMCFFHWLNIA